MCRDGGRTLLPEGTEAQRPGTMGFQVGQSPLKRAAVDEAGEKERKEAGNRVLHGRRNDALGSDQPEFKSWFYLLLAVFCYRCGCWFSHLYMRITVLSHSGL